MAKKNALGRGLSSLLSDADKAEEVKSEKEETEIVSALDEIDLDKIVPNPTQPRTEFSEEALDELAASISSIGVVQPITVRPEKNGKYEIIAGERRYRAAKKAGLKTIPAYIKRVEDGSVLEMALIENIQREDLNAIEVAMSFQRLIDECNLTQDSLSDKVGKKRSTISNYLRLLRLPAKIQVAVRDKQLSMGHARALLAIDDADMQMMIFEQTLQYDYSVRKVEEIIKELTSPKDDNNDDKNNNDDKIVKPDNLGDYAQLQEQLTKRLRTKVQLKRNDKGRGKIIIGFKSDAELEWLVGLFDKMN